MSFRARFILVLSLVSVGVWAAWSYSSVAIKWWSEWELAQWIESSNDSEALIRSAKKLRGIPGREQLVQRLVVKAAEVSRHEWDKVRALALAPSPNTQPQIDAYSATLLNAAKADRPDPEGAIMHLAEIALLTRNEALLKNLMETSLALPPGEERSGQASLFERALNSTAMAISRSGSPSIKAEFARGFGDVLAKQGSSLPTEWLLSLAPAIFLSKVNYVSKPLYRNLVDTVESSERKALAEWKPHNSVSFPNTHMTTIVRGLAATGDVEALAEAARILKSLRIPPDEEVARLIGIQRDAPLWQQQVNGYTKTGRLKIAELEAKVGTAYLELGMVDEARPLIAKASKTYDELSPWFAENHAADVARYTGEILKETKGELLLDGIRTALAGGKLADAYDLALSLPNERQGEALALILRD